MSGGPPFYLQGVSGNETLKISEQKTNRFSVIMNFQLLLFSPKSPKLQAHQNWGYP